MIFDKIQNWHFYFNGALAQQIHEEINSFINKNEVGEKVLIPGKLFIKSMTYDLFDEDSAGLQIESHKNWIDIQFTIEGVERIDVFSRDNLLITKTDKKNDVIFYKTNNNVQCSVNNHQGYFLILFPWDAHRPKMKTNPDVANVKKAVIKLDYELYRNLIDNK